MVQPFDNKGRKINDLWLWKYYEKAVLKRTKEEATLNVYQQNALVMLSNKDPEPDEDVQTESKMPEGIMKSLCKVKKYNLNTISRCNVEQFGRQQLEDITFNREQKDVLKKRRESRYSKWFNTQKIRISITKRIEIECYHSNFKLWIGKRSCRSSGKIQD